MIKENIKILQNIVLVLAILYTGYVIIAGDISQRHIVGKIFDFILLFMFVFVMGGGLIPQVAKGEQFEWKDIIKLMIFVGIIAFFLGAFN